MESGGKSQSVVVPFALVVIHGEGQAGGLADVVVGELVVIQLRVTPTRLLRSAMVALLSAKPAHLGQLRASNSQD